jgi:hypothetical protein
MTITTSKLLVRTKAPPPKSSSSKRMMSMSPTFDPLSRTVPPRPYEDGKLPVLACELGPVHRCPPVASLPLERDGGTPPKLCLQEDRCLAPNPLGLVSHHQAIVHGQRARPDRPLVGRELSLSPASGDLSGRSAGRSSWTSRPTNSRFSFASASHSRSSGRARSSPSKSLAISQAQ